MLNIDKSMSYNQRRILYFNLIFEESFNVSESI